MAAITELLDKIKTAVYGKDVRQSIHDAIQQCYYDGKAGSIDLEGRQIAADAIEVEKSERKQEIAVERERINQFTSLTEGSTTGDAELQDIRIGAGGEVYASAGEAVRGQAMKLDSTLTDPKKAAPANLVGELRSDLIDLNDIHVSLTEKTYIDSSNGSVGINYETGYSTNYIYIARGCKIILKDVMPEIYAHDFVGYAFYDKNKNYISGVSYSSGVTGYELDIPQNAEYIRFTVIKNNESVFRVIIPFPAEITMENKNRLNELEPYQYNEYSVPMASGGYIYTVDGSVQPFWKAMYSDYIDADLVQKVYTSLSEDQAIVFYDKNKNYISGIDENYLNTSGEMKWYDLTNKPTGTKYIRISCAYHKDEDIVKAITVYSLSAFYGTDENKNRLDELENKIKGLENTGFNPVNMYDKTIHIGDSLTYSVVYTDSNNNRQAFNPYPEVFAKLCDVEQETYAFGGATTKTWWNRYKESAFISHGLYIVFLGTNEGLTDTIDSDCSGEDLTQYADTLTGYYGRILQSIKNNGDKAVLIKPYTVGSSATTKAITNSVIDKFAVRYDFPAIDIDCAERTDEYLHFYDDKSGKNTLHFNDLGYVWEATKIKKQICNMSVSDKFKIRRTQ